jgi:putative nucleotidyltransferase with HDIG domain
MKKRILFVDDEPSMLELFRLLFKPMESEWDVDFARGGLEGLALMEKEPFQVVITDMNMPGMNGAQFLNEVMQRHPQSARLILSGYAEQETVAKCVGAAHQYLMKPCDVISLRTILSRVCALDVFLKNETLQGLVSRMGVLPSIPSVYFQVLKELQSPYASLDRIGELLATDPAMAAKILQLVNSAFFGVSRRISHPSEAVQLLGVGTVRSLALSLHAFSCFDQSKMRNFSFEPLWNHSLTTALLAKRIAQGEEVDLATVDEAFISGLLHDLGKLMLVANMPDEYEAVLDRARLSDCSLHEAEQEMFGATHADVGAYLLGLWGLPVPIVEAVALHHHPERNVHQAFTPLTAVHVANGLDHERTDAPTESSPSKIHSKYLADLGMEDRLPRWRDALGKWNLSTDHSVS